MVYFWPTAAVSRTFNTNLLCKNKLKRKALLLLKDYYLAQEGEDIGETN